MSIADRLLDILDLFTLERPNWAVDAAATALDMPTSTVYRYFNSLAKRGLIVTIGGGRYTLGPAVVRYDRQLRLTDPLIRSAEGEMAGLAELVAGKGVVFLCRLFGNQVLCVSQISVGDLPFRISYERGRLMPLFAGSASRVILASLPSPQIKALYRGHSDDFSQNGFGNTLPEVQRTLKDIRLQGSVATVGEVDSGMRGISVPIVTNSRITGSLNIAGPRQGFSAITVDRAVAALRDSARRIVGELNRWTD